MYAFHKSLRKAEHIRRYSITPGAAGWEVREERDSRVVRHQHYQDWHRVERAERVFSIEIASLREQGWREAG